MNDRIAILRQAITVITQTLTQSEVEVTQVGLDAFVKSDASGKPVLVNLPYLPDNADESLVNAIQGFLDHEVAHILFSDFTELNKVKHQPRLKNLINILEDARIEKEMGKKYRGSNANLTNTGEFFLENIVQPGYEEVISKGGSQEQLVGKLAVPLLRGMSGQYIYKDYMKDKMTHIQDFYDKISDLEPKMEALSSTKDVVGLAKVILKRLEEDENNDDQDDQDENQDESGGGNSTGPSEGKEDESETEVEGEGDGKGESKGGEGKEGDGEGEGEDTKAEKKQTDQDVSNLKNSRCLEEMDKESANNYSDAIVRKMGEQAALAAKGSKYLVYTNKDDVIEPLKVGKSYAPKMLATLSDKVDSMIGPMSKELERAMVARSKAVWEGGLRRGRLNSSSLSRLTMGDDRVFRKKHESTNKDVAVSLVVDISGSMSGRKIYTAAAAAYALSQVLERLSISHEVICFTTKNSPVPNTEYAAQQKKYGVTFSRMDAIYMPIIKGFGERVTTETKQRFAWLPHITYMFCNVDGECVEIAYRRLQTRKEAGKIMIVLSDGCPAASGDPHALSRHLKDTVEKIEKSGTKIIGIGINSTEVRKFYTKNITVNKIEELPKGVIKELRTMLLG
ncbi:cobaltochelatase CobT-related protein [Acinetobacter brisouii]|uniref:cobaltochelatase CobT-related protein n=1 Tax=Acinetobacter brisouii TaxID=396323 RepID=UPI00124E6488|nr:cobalamin biosynthesis protein CobT [Acinetobacter brisouii]